MKRHLLRISSCFSLSIEKFFEKV
uniref:Uncharacterized protein n=1 Tax=Rhizophora mucronata TaxID=61149 RepID=A0A2P2NBW7_RHIMU